MPKLYDAVICFVLFSFIGWICESVFCSILEKKPVNRGFLNGPLCPVYGFGGLIIVYLLGPISSNWFLTFFCGMIACTLLEYCTSWLLEKLFKAKWWDYSHKRFNINGRVCLDFSLVFGVLSVIAAELIYPPATWLLAAIPERGKLWLSVGLVAVIAADCAVTVASMVQLNEKLAELKRIMEELRQKLETNQGERVPLSKRIENYLAERGVDTESVQSSVDAAIKRLESLTGRHKRQHRRLLKAFPNLNSTRYQEQLAKIRESLAKRGKKKEEKTPKE